MDDLLKRLFEKVKSPWGLIPLSILALWLVDAEGRKALRAFLGLLGKGLTEPRNWEFFGIGLFLTLALLFAALLGICLYQRRLGHCRDIKLHIAMRTGESARVILRGREGLLEAMRAALENPSVAVLTLSGLGGIGKSLLALAFIENLIARERHSLSACLKRKLQRGDVKLRVFAWSFESERAGHGELDTLAPFWNAALRFWDFQELSPGNLDEMDASEKARHLADAIKTQRSVLILDNVEALQRADGQLKDLTLVTFLESLRYEGIGADSLLVVISRRVILGLRGGDSLQTMRSIDGDRLRLNSSAGAQVLRDHGVIGTDKELEVASDQLNGHPLALSLAGTALATHFRGVVTQLPDILSKVGDEDPVTSLFSYYIENWPPSSPQVSLLQFAALFGRLFHLDELLTLLRRTLPVTDFEELSPDIKGALSELLGVDLVMVTTTVGQEKLYDMHALATSYFAARFADEDPMLYRKANAILYQEALRRAPALAMKVEDLPWLYRAVYHACHAELHRLAFNRIYLKRISQGRRFYNASMLGDRLGDMAAISCFFPQGIESGKNARLFAPQRWWLVARAAFNLSSLGRFEESVAPRLVGIEIVKGLKAWGFAADDSRRLVHTLVELGRLQEAKVYINRALDFARRYRDHPEANHVITFVKGKDPDTLWKRCVADKEYVAMLMGQAGNVQAIWEAYDVGEDRVMYHRPLLALVAHREDLERVSVVAEASLAVARVSGTKNAIANEAIVLGRALLHLGKLDKAEPLIDEARALMQDGGRVDGLMRALVDKAALLEARWHICYDNRLLQQATAMLDELEQQVTFSGAQLLHVDGELVRIAISNDQGHKAEARSRLTVLTGIVARMGYHLRDQDVAKIRAEVGP